MLKNSVFLILLLISGCHHEKREPYYIEPQIVLEPEPTSAIIEAPKHSHEDVEIQADVPMETKAVEARPQMRDAQIQTEEELMESLDLGEDLEDERQEIAPRLQRSLSDMTIYESEYLEESEDDL